MQLSQALETIAKEYPNGCVEFFDALPNNPWQAAHDRLEGAIILHRGGGSYFNLISRACDEFVKEIRKLMALYRATNPEQPSLPSLQDAFVIADEDKVRQIQSLTDCSCRVCGATDNIRAAAHPKHGAALYCPNCLRASA